MPKAPHTRLTLHAVAGQLERGVRQHVFSQGGASEVFTCCLARSATGSMDCTDLWRTGCLSRCGSLVKCEETGRILCFWPVRNWHLGGCDYLPFRATAPQPRSARTADRCRADRAAALRSSCGQLQERGHFEAGPERTSAAKGWLSCCLTFELSRPRRQAA